ncbi:SETMAR [Cordylochernes scorpioides]|uniref:SETMAR n=1 Tax=Cordylochernes scorpioides TaxID=51811 RepID=A0ABY6L5M3_9ARAC|nr:SETMAR [Cordylochernes scorpioides]
MVIYEPKSAHLREVLLFAFNWKKSATEAHRLLEEVHDDHALSKSQCYRWFEKFQSGDFELYNEPRGKPHQKFEDAEQQALLDEDSTQTQKKLAKQLQVSQGAVSLRLNSLRMTQKLSRWVPHELSESQQERRLVTCEGLLARHEKKSFLHRIVTSDEKSIHLSNPMRQKSWGQLGQFPKQKPRPNRLGKKAMLYVWWDQTGVVYFKLLKPGETVNTSRYEQQMHSLREALNEIRPELREKHNKLILQHDNAPAHNATVVKNTIKDLGWALLPHPPYSIDLAPSDYYLFTFLGHALKNQEFSNSDILRKWLVEWFDSKGIEFFRQGIRKLPERWSEYLRVELKQRSSIVLPKQQSKDGTHKSGRFTIPTTGHPHCHMWWNSETPLTPGQIGGEKERRWRNKPDHSNETSKQSLPKIFTEETPPQRTSAYPLTDHQRREQADRANDSPEIPAILHLRLDIIETMASRQQATSNFPEVTSVYKLYMERLQRQQEYKPRPSFLTELSHNYLRVELKQRSSIVLPKQQSKDGTHKAGRFTIPTTGHPHCHMWWNSETPLTPGQDTKLNQNLRFNIKDYTTLRKDRPGKFGGGLAVLIKTLEIKFKEIAYNQNKTIPIINVYNHNNTSINTGLIETLSEASSDIAIILGDFNSERPTWGSPFQDNKGQQVEDMLTDLDLTPLNNEKNTYLSKSTGRESAIDITAINYNIAPTTQWKILKKYKNTGKIFTEKLEELCNEELNHRTIDKKLEKFSSNISKAEKVSIPRGRRKDQKVKYKMSPGDALIFGQMIKHFGDKAKNQLLRILKISWQTGKLPKNWKISIIVPILTPNKDAKECKNYRPIALTSILWKRHFLPGLMIDQPYDTIIQRIKLHLDPKKKVIPQRCRFLKRIHQEGESISEYLRELIHLAINFGKRAKEATTRKRRCHPGYSFAVAIVFEQAQINTRELQDKLVAKISPVNGKDKKGIDSSIEELTRECRVCQESASMPPATISEWTWPEKPWHRHHLDLADNGRQFVSGEFEKFTKMNGIRHTKTSPYNPSTNGLAERYEFPRGTANEDNFKIKILEFNTKMGNPREVFHEAVRRQEQFTTGCEVYFRNYATELKRTCNNCPGVELTPTHIFSCPAMASALQKIDIDPEQLLHTPKIVDNAAAAVIEMHGDI